MIKWIFDRLVALLATIILSPVMLIIAGMILIDMGSPALFKQQRPGMFGRKFTLYKFRTMSRKVDASGKLLPDAERMTRLGRILRNSSLDELPSLINVLMGQMSFVGPRPLLIEYLDLYTPEQNRRHELRPGITGWAQINGRNAISWEKKFELDIWYVNNQSLYLDFKILIMTLLKVLKRSDITSSTSATMEKFEGNK